MCPIYEQSADWLDRAAEWAALADDVAKQRHRGAELAPLSPALAVRQGINRDGAVSPEPEH